MLGADVGAVVTESTSTEIDVGWRMIQNGSNQHYPILFRGCGRRLPTTPATIENFDRVAALAIINRLAAVVPPVVVVGLVVPGLRRRWSGAGGREGLQGWPCGVKDFPRSRCHQCGGDGHSRQSSAPPTPPPPVVSTRTLTCAKCDTPMDDHYLFGACFPHDMYLRESSVLLHQGHLIAV